MRFSEPENSPDGERPEDRAGRISRLLARVIFYAMLLLIILTAIPYGTVEAWWVALFEIIVFLLAALWTVEGLLGRRGWVGREHRLLVPLLALVAYALIQTLPFGSGDAMPAGAGGGEAVRATTSADSYETRLFALRLLALTLASALLLRYTSSMRRLRALVWCVVGVGFVSALFGILRQTMHRAGQGGFLLPLLVSGSGYGQFINRNHFAYLAEMSLGLALGLIAAKGVARNRVLLVVALALPIWTALVLSNSRGGILAMFCQVGFLALTFNVTDAYSSNKKQNPQRPPLPVPSMFALRVVSAAGLLVVIMAGAIWMGGDEVSERLASMRDEMGNFELSADRNDGSRAAIWKSTWEMIKEHPLTGVGFGAYWIAISSYHRGSGTLVPSEAHNDYLELLASGGIAGVALAGWFVVLVIRRALRRLRTGDAFSRAAALGATAGLFGVAVHSLFDFGLHVTINALVCLALVCLAAARVDAQPDGIAPGGAGRAEKQKTSRSGY